MFGLFEFQSEIHWLWDLNAIGGLWLIDILGENHWNCYTMGSFMWSTYVDAELGLNLSDLVVWYKAYMLLVISNVKRVTSAFEFRKTRVLK